MQQIRWSIGAPEVVRHDVYRSSRDISTSGLGGHISISGCQTHLATLFLNSP